MDLSAVLMRLRPGCVFSQKNNDPRTIWWHPDNLHPAPSLEEIETTWLAITQDILKKEDIKAASIAFKAYVEGKFDTETRQFLFSMLADDSLEKDSKDAIGQIRDWFSSVLAHYLEVVKQRQSGVPLQTTGWNLSQFDATVPKVDIVELIRTIYGPS